MDRLSKETAESDPITKALAEFASNEVPAGKPKPEPEEDDEELVEDAGVSVGAGEPTDTGTSKPAAPKAEAEAEAEAEAGEEPGEDEGPPEGFVTIELPDALKEQGFDSFDVPKEQEDLFRALVNDYEGRRLREERMRQLEQEEKARLEEIREFRLLIETQPFEVINVALGQQEAEETFRYWLLQDPERWNRFVDWFESVGSTDEDLKRAKRELELAYKERRMNAIERVRFAEHARENAKQAQERLAKAIEQIDPAERDWIVERIARELKALALEKRERYGYAYLEPDELDAIVQPWIDKFPAKEAPKKEQARKAVQTAQERVRQRVAASKAARRTLPVGSERLTTAKATAGKRMTLDDMLAALKRGEVEI